MKKPAVAALVAVLLLCGCGPRAITKGSIPFPAKKGIFADASGAILSNLPDSEEPFLFVFLDFAWCPACQNVWNTLIEASETTDPGSVRIYRILFDRETVFAESGSREAAPLRPASARLPGYPGNVKIVVLVALPEAFREEFRVNQAPLLLLINREGEVERRWQGYSTNLKDELLAELSKSAPSR